MLIEERTTNRQQQMLQGTQAKTAPYPKGEENQSITDIVVVVFLCI